MPGALEDICTIASAFQYKQGAAAKRQEKPSLCRGAEAGQADFQYSLSMPGELFN